MELEELTEWRDGGLGHLITFLFLFLSVGTWSSANGVGMGFITSGNQVNWRWSLSVHQKVTLDGTAQSWDL
jgi:hypothetical protein